MKKELICIRCPLGCHMTAEWAGDFENFRVTGNRCPRGAAYAEQELKDPRRIVTAVVKSNSERSPYLPVRTNGELPKHLIASLLNYLYTLEVKLPVKMGDILLKNYEKTGIDIIFSSSTGERKMEWISHRGESMDAPENTLSAFNLAMERNSDGFETDVHLTADGVLVCIHDSETGRVAGENLVVEKSTFEALSKLDYCNGKTAYKGEKIPEFRELLAILNKNPGKRLFTEIKCNDEKVLEAVALEMKKAGTQNSQIVIISFHEDIIRVSKKYLPEVKSLWLTGFKKTDDGCTPTPQKTIEFLKEAKADGIDASAQKDEFNAEYIRALKAENFEIAIWTVNKKEDAEHFCALGVDAITSDCAAKLCKEIEGR